MKAKLMSILMSVLAVLMSLLGGVIDDVTADDTLLAKVAYPKFLGCSEKAYLTPGKEEYFIPQGLTYSEELDCFVVSGYMENEIYNEEELEDDASRLYFIDSKSGETVKMVRLRNASGSLYTGHAGGVAAYESSIWVVSGSTANRLPVEDIKNASDGDYVSFKDSFKTGNRASYASVSNGILWIGEYYKDDGSYATDESHHLTSPSGEKQCAWTFGYVLESGNEKGFDYENKSTPTPDYALSTEDMCQGFVQLPDGRFATSISGSIINSKLNIYSNVLDKDADMYVEIGGENVPLWFLDSTRQEKSLTMLPRSEGIVYDESTEKIVVLFESGAMKMRASQIIYTDYLWKTDVGAF